MDVEAKLKAMGLELPASAKPGGVYVPAVRSGNLVFTAGQIPTREGRLVADGKVAADMSLEEAQAAARQACLNALAAVRDQLGPLEEVGRIVRVNVFVNSAPGFTDQAKVADAASELLVELFGQAGRHTRCAVGAAELPLNAPVEVDLIAELRKAGRD